MTFTQTIKNTISSQKGDGYYFNDFKYSLIKGEYCILIFKNTGKTKKLLKEVMLHQTMDEIKKQISEIIN